jgi:Uma2 family endonuclease
LGMPASMTIELPDHEEQTEFNLKRWDEICADTELGRQLAHMEGRIETDRHGYVIMSPPPAFDHGRFQFEIAYRLRQLLEEGTVVTECPISTADGVRAADVAWVSRERLEKIGGRVCLRAAPEICVEVLSPGNTWREMGEKKALFFVAGAVEVWFCHESGVMQFFRTPDTAPVETSDVCPEFPRSIA